jgi:hypothetical protein
MVISRRVRNQTWQSMIICLAQSNKAQTNKAQTMNHFFYYLLILIGVFLFILFYSRTLKSKYFKDHEKPIIIEKDFTHPFFQERNKARDHYLTLIKYQNDISNRFRHLHESHLQHTINEDQELVILTQLQQQYLTNRQQTSLAYQQYLEKQQCCFEYLLTEILPQVVTGDLFRLDAHCLSLDGKLGLAPDLEHNKLFIWRTGDSEAAYIIDGIQLLQLEAHVDSECLYSLKAEDLSNTTSLASTSISQAIFGTRLIDRLLSLELKLFIKNTEDPVPHGLTLLFFQRGSAKSPYTALEEMDNWYCLLGKLIHQSQLKTWLSENKKAHTANSMINEISHLSELKNQGLLTEAEFNKAKRMLLK